MSQTIEQQSVAFRSGAATHLPPQVAKVFEAEQRRWRDGGQPQGTVKPGDVMEPVTLLDPQSQPVALADLWAQGPLVVVFYRGGWCPYCNIALRTYQSDLLPALAGLGAGLVAISPERPDQSLSTQEKAELAYAVLSDPGSAVARRLGIAFQQADDVLAAQRTLGLDLTQVNVEGSTELPMPTVLVIDRSGVVRFADVHPDYTSRTEVAAILDAVRGLD
jgi:peroxiredoxin